MKRLWVSLVLIVAVVAATFGGSFHFKQINRQVGALMLEAEQAVAATQWAEAKQLTEQAYSAWHDNAFFLYSTMRHTDTDAIYVALEQAMGCTAIEDEHGFVTAARAVLSKLWLMEESDALSLENIL